jgi:hypothetical protein
MSLVTISSRALLALCSILLFQTLIPASAEAAIVRKEVPFHTRVASCSGERIRIRGEFRSLMVSHENRDGTVVTHFTSVPRHIIGVSRSGTRYRAVGANTDTFVVKASGKFTHTESSHLFSLISHGREGNLVVHAISHVTVLPGFKIVAFVDHFTARCVGSRRH